MKLFSMVKTAFELQNGTIFVLEEETAKVIVFDNKIKMQRWNRVPLSNICPYN